MQYYEVTVKFITETDEGKVKAVKEKYLVETNSVEVANNKITEFLKDTPSHFEIYSIKESNIDAVIE